MLYKGFKFGMLLQLAVGPVCLFIFQSAVSGGFYAAESGVLGVVIIDGLFIIAALTGLSAIIERKNVKPVLKITGAIILFIFGSATILGQLNIQLLPALNFHNNSVSGSLFLKALLLTVSNPLTIVFWAGVFSGKVAEENMDRRSMYYFASGALLSTLFFLTLTSLAGGLSKTFLPAFVIVVLNLVVGFSLIYFSIRMLLKVNK